MGQYYFVVNTTKCQYLDPHKFNDGLKLLEFGCSADGTMTALAVLLADGNGRGGGDLDSKNRLVGSWAGDRIVIAGDYADAGKFLTEQDISQFEVWYKREKPDEYAEWVERGKPTPNLFSVAECIYEDISADVLVALTDDGYLREQVIKTYRKHTENGYDGPFVRAVNSHPVLAVRIAGKKPGSVPHGVEVPAPDSPDALKSFDME